MAIVRAQVSFGADLPEVRHRFVITPHFNASTLIPGDEPGWQTLCDDLATAMNTYTANVREVEVKVYDAEANAPNYPKARKVLNSGLYPASGGMREVALCLSYRGGDGPRRRGRLYIPGPLISSGAGGTLRPTASQQQKVADLAPILRALGGANVQWGVWSRADQAFYETESAHVDNEWDVIRSRGLAPTTRLTAGTGS